MERGIREHNQGDFSKLIMLHDTAKGFQGQTRSQFANNSHDIFEIIYYFLI